LRSNTGSLYSNFRRLYTHGGSSFAKSVGKSSFFNSGSFLDPLVAGIHVFYQVVIGNYILWNITADSGYFGAGHSKQNLRRK
jgi:hypothetical protein